MNALYDESHLGRLCCQLGMQLMCNHKSAFIIPPEGLWMTSDYRLYCSSVQLLLSLSKKILFVQNFKILSEEIIKISKHTGVCSAFTCLSAGRGVKV